MLFKDTIGVCSQSHMKERITPCGQSSEILNNKADSLKSKHCVQRVKITRTEITSLHIFGKSYEYVASLILLCYLSLWFWATVFWFINHLQGNGKALGICRVMYYEVVCGL